MPGSTLELTRYIPPFLKSFLHHTTPCYIQKLPVDLWIDEIFIHLTIEDVICLRRVSSSLAIRRPTTYAYPLSSRSIRLYFSLLMNQSFGNAFSFAYPSLYRLCVPAFVGL